VYKNNYLLKKASYPVLIKTAACFLLLPGLNVATTLFFIA